MDTVDETSAQNKTSTAGAADVPLFALCQLFERVSKTTKLSDRRSILQTFFAHYTDDDYFALLRLLLPKLDRERQTYGMKESVLGKLYVEILGISASSEDAQRLVHWKRPTGGGNGKADSGGDFGNAVYLSLHNRCVSRGDLSLAQLNTALDELNRVTDRKDKMRVLKELIRRTTAEEQKWIVRIILKDLKIGMSEKVVLNYFHKDAQALYDVSSNLRTVCQDLKDPTVRLGAAVVGAGLSKSQLTLTLGNPIKPMLASSYNIEQIIKLMGHKPFVIENKYDGERIQIHKNDRDVKIFSRKAKDYTDQYKRLIPEILKSVAARRCILDGELLVWDTITEQFEPFGGLKTTARHGHRHGDDDDAPTQPSFNADTAASVGKQMCYIIFDMIYVGDRSLMDRPLYERLSELRRAVPKPRPKLVEIVEQKQGQTVADIVNVLDDAIANREEGIIIKNPLSVYVPAERKTNWIKLKPEYIDGLSDDLDLLIVGGYWGTGARRGGAVASFMLGVRAPSRADDDDEHGDDGDEPDAPNAADAQPIFYSVGKVGSGYSDQRLKELNDHLGKHWRPYKVDNPPHCLQLAPGHKEKPDVWIDPKVSCVVQIKAAQLNPTDKYRAGYTLRFPRMVRPRDDKDWFEAMTFDELLALAHQSGGRLIKRKFDDELDDDADEQRRPKKKRAGKAKTSTDTTRRARALLAQQRPLDVSTVQRSSELFGGVEMCVVNGDELHSKRDIELLIHKNGGRLVQHAGADTRFVIAGRRVLKVANLVHQAAHDIVHYRWLFDCINDSAAKPLQPKYMLHTLPQTRSEFLQESDQFGDSFSVDATEQSLREAFAQVDCEVQQGNVELPASLDIAQLEARCFDERKPFWALFRGYRVYVDRFIIVGNPKHSIPGSPLDITAALLRFYGAQLTDDIDETTTHIVLDKRDRTRSKQIRARIRSAMEKPGNIDKHVVDKSWVTESVDAHEDYDESDYVVKL
eukprot:TRINITY_DN7271_c0_g1_i3.p1 TRINITY_DN7271_c0_g1~~TRINITY_DN7271_c0_g1_i3.p1  ORF type:complete len:974 (-),score=418.09 TRINITY_DN7271_c0_g1_i3:27-2948(-)